MGGKSKQAHRTKNNSRPSNSGRSAELLGSTLPPFSGFATMDAGLLTSVPGFAGFDNINDELDKNVDINFQLTIKKMMKKDPTTKIKGLQEFTELVNATDVEIIKTILLLWPRLYTNLATDVEHRVREGAQQAQAAVVAKMGKHIAPQLKDMAPAWVTSQFDTYAPAASVAYNSFHMAFPTNKVQSVLAFCQNEILEYISANLTIHTPQTVCNPKSYTTDECEGKYQRVVICSLRGYSLYISTFAAELANGNMDKHRLIISSSKFWNFGKHREPMIRAVWFEVMATILQNAVFLLANFKQKLIDCVISNLNESDPLILPHVWSCMLLIQTNVENWNSSISFEKNLLPKIFRMLKTGGGGNGPAIFPSVLPFISKFNKDIMTDTILLKFFIDMFDNYKVGLIHLGNACSRSEVSAIAVSYYECLQYVMDFIRTTSIVPDKNVELELLKSFVNNHFLDIINLSFTVNHHNAKFIFCPLNSVLCYWTQHIEDNRPIITYFWEKLYDLFTKSMTSTNMSNTLSAHYELLDTLRRGKSTKRNAKVTFGEDKCEATSGKTQLVTNTGDSLYDLVFKVCRLYLKELVNHKSVLVLIALYNTLKLFHSEQLFCQIANNDLNGFSNRLVTLLKNDSICDEPLVDIILMVHNYMDNPTDSVALLNTLILYPNEKVQLWAINRYLAHPLCNLPQMSAVLSQEAVTQMIRVCAESVVATNSHEYLTLLHKCFFQTNEGNLLISSDAATAVCCVFMTEITNSARSTIIDTCASFLAHIVPVICSDPEKKELQHALFLCLFKFSLCNSQQPNSEETHDALWEVNAAWQDILISREMCLDDALLGDCIKLIHARLDQLPELGSEKSDEIADIVAHLVVSATFKLSVDIRETRANEIMKMIFTFSKYQQMLDSAERIALILEAVHGPMTAVIFDNNDLVDITNPVAKIESYTIMAAFKLAVIWKLVDSKMAGDNNPYYGIVDENGHVDRSNNLKIPTEWVMDAVLSYAIFHTMVYKCAKLSTITEELMLDGMERLGFFCNGMRDSELMEFKDGLLDRAEADGNMWAKSVFFLSDLRHFIGFRGVDEVCQDLLMSDNKPTLMDVQIMQVICPKVTSRLLPIDNKMIAKEADLLIQICTVRVLLKNYYSAHYMHVEDKEILNISYRLMNDISKMVRADSMSLLFNTNLTDRTNDQIQFTIEAICFVDDILSCFPLELDVRSWDFIRIAVSSWVLTVSKAINSLKTVDANQVKICGFIASVYKLFGTLSKFLDVEAKESSSELLKKLMDEWNTVFARDVNILLLKGFMSIVSLDGKYILDVVCPALAHFDCNHILKYFQDGTRQTFRSLFQFCLEGFSSDIHSVRIGCATLIKRLAPHLMVKDFEYLEKNNKNNELYDEAVDHTWHLLARFRNTIDLHHAIVGTFIDDLHDEKIDLINSTSRQRHACLAFLQLWECILTIFANARAELRSYYARWISQNKLEKFMLTALFELMPDSLNAKCFMLMDDDKLSQNDVQVCRFACHNYTQTLRYLPAVTRKWWQDLAASTKTMVDKVTTEYVSTVLCHEELATLNSKKENYDNMQITVHTSAREVKAVYTKDQARIELVIALPRNYPLGQIKVSCGKQVGGMVASDLLEMQLSIFLTHQNGLILDGLSLWKSKLDHRFEGVEECYVCYSVIHQDTYQLPKQTCKTCKKKFHGPCLYQWFNTSNKSTCPICRNMF